MFYGWRIVGVAFVTHFISVGFLFYSYGAFFKALSAEFGGSRLGTAVGLTIVNVVTAALSPFLGRVLDRWSIRWLMCGGAVLLSAGFALISRVESLAQFYLLLGTFVAVGSALLGGLAGSTLVANWFSARRGTALGVATMGISLSGMVMAPVATWLIAEIGWRDTFVVYAVLGSVIVLPVVWLVVVNRPEELGLLPDGAAAPPDPDEEAQPPILPLAPGDQVTDHLAPRPGTTREALGDRNFWAISMAVALNFCANGAILTHAIPHATDIGVAPLEAAWVLSTIAGVGVAGKVLFGTLGDRMSQRAALWLATGLQLIGLALFIPASSYGALIGASAVFGLGMGGIVPLWGALVGAAFGRESFGSVMGLMSPFMIPVQMFGIPFAGWVFDRSGTYEPAFLSFLGVYLLAMAALGFARLPRP